MERESQEKKRAVAAKKREKKRQNKKEKQEKEKIPTRIYNPDLATDNQGKDEVLEDKGVPPMTTVTSTIGNADLDDSGKLPEKLKNSDRELGKLGDSEHENQAPGLSSPKKDQKEEEGWTEVKAKKISKRVQVSSSAISRVIGRGGCNINSIREVSGARIKIEKQKRNDGEQEITIKGSPEGTKQALDLIMSLVSDPEKKLFKLIPKYTDKQPLQKKSIYLSDDTSVSTTSSVSSFVLSSVVTSSSSLADGGRSVSRSLTNTNERLPALPAIIGVRDGPPTASTITSPQSPQKSSSFSPTGLNLERKKSIFSNLPGYRPTSIKPIIPQKMEAQRTNNFSRMQPVRSNEKNQSSNQEHPLCHNDTQVEIILDFADLLGPKKEDERKKWGSGGEKDSQRKWDTDEERSVHEKKLLNPQKKTAKIWMRQARLDLRSATVLLDGINADSYEGYNSVCLLCHEAIEKSVKAAMFTINANDVKHSHVFSDNIPKNDKSLLSLCLDLSKLIGNIRTMRYPYDNSIPADRYTCDHASEAINQSEKIIENILKKYFT